MTPAFRPCHWRGAERVSVGAAVVIIGGLSVCSWALAVGAAVALLSILGGP